MTLLLLLINDWTFFGYICKQCLSLFIGNIKFIFASGRGGKLAMQALIMDVL